MDCHCSRLCRGPNTGWGGTETAEFTKVAEPLQDIRSGNLSDFTRPTTLLPDRIQFQKASVVSTLFRFHTKIIIM